MSDNEKHNQVVNEVTCIKIEFKKVRVSQVSMEL